MAQVKFERTSAPTGSVEFSINPPEGGYDGSQDYLQPFAQADGGNFYCFDKGIDPERPRSFAWEAMPEADFTNLLAFYAVVLGKKYNFTFTDYDGTTYTARFITKISWGYRENGTLNASFDIRIE